WFFHPRVVKGLCRKGVLLERTITEVRVSRSSSTGISSNGIIDSSTGNWDR
ncbi:29370_t:CDS:2, partial [Gigaspora margarita]